VVVNKGRFIIHHQKVTRNIVGLNSWSCRSGAVHKCVIVVAKCRDRLEDNNAHSAVEVRADVSFGVRGVYIRLGSWMRRRNEGWFAASNKRSWKLLKGSGV
jgi:hypothetical protein